MKIKQRVWCWDFTFHQCCDGHVIHWSRCQLDDIANLSILKSHPESPPQTVRHDDLTSKNIFIRMHVCFLLVTFKQFRMCLFFFVFFFAHQKKFFNVVLHFSIPHTLYLSYQCVMSTLSLIHHFLSLTSTGVCQFSSLDKAQVSSSGPERLRISKTKLSVEVVSLQIFLSIYSVVSCCSVGTVYPNLGKKEVYYWIRNWIYFDGQRKKIQVNITYLVEFPVKL